MLKIKEDKMQELEKMGFEKCQRSGGHTHFYSIYRDRKYGLYLGIEIMQDRTITLNLDCDEAWADKLDILYEFFANDMVEVCDDKTM